jgi:myo-inositol-1(or 4)-monophosphatase
LRASEAIDDRPALMEQLASAVREAGALALKSFDTAVPRWAKADGSPVTEADMAVDRLLRRSLGEALPGSAWLSEESLDDPARLAARRLWVVDPIDGTRAFIGGRPDWSIAAALVEDGRPVLAAVFAPVEQSMFLAILGGGATLNGAPVRASTGAALAGARIAGPKRYIEAIAHLLPDATASPKIYSLALRLSRVAQGTLDAAFASGSSHDWDLAAADLLVHEAGGALTLLDGRALTYNRAVPVHGALVAAGGARHAKLLELLHDRRAELA